MRIGVPKELKNNENRVAMSPAGVVTLKNAGHEVYIETGAGLGSGFTDEDFAQAGRSDSEYSEGSMDSRARYESKRAAARGI